MIRVIYVGDNPTLIGATAIQRSDGKVQLDGKDDWKKPPEQRNPLCYGWHDLGEAWKEKK